MNNFDQSSTGLNITVSAFRDTDLSRFYFEEAFFTIKEGRKDLLVYCEGNFLDFEKEYSFTKEALKHAWNEYNNVAAKRATYGFSDKMGFSYSKATKQDLIDFIKEELYENYEWVTFCDKARFKSNFDIVVSRGYCQGDCREVIVPHKFWDIVGIPKPLDVQSNLGACIDNLLWDCPVYCRFEVNEQEFYIDQELKNSYEWDKVEALEIAAKMIKDSFTSEEQGIIMDFLSSSLKTDLDYL
jgi:hypothetical protein